MHFPLAIKYYYYIFFRPFMNLSGFLLISLFSIVACLSMIFVFILISSQDRLFTEIKSVYPNVFFYGKNYNSDNLRNVILKREALIFNRSISYSTGKNKLNILKFNTNIRALDFTCPEVRTSLREIMGDKKNSVLNKNSILVSERLWSAVMPCPDTRYKGRNLFLVSWTGEKKKLEVVHIFPMETGEKWLFMPLTLWKDVDDKTNGETNIFSLYSRDARREMVERAQAVVEGRYRVQTWRDLCPFYYKALFTLMNGGVWFFLSVMVALVGFYLTSLILIFFFDNQVAINLIRLFGCRKGNVFLFLNGAFVMVTGSTLFIGTLFAVGIIALKSMLFDSLHFINIYSFIHANNWLPLNLRIWVPCGLLGLSIILSSLLLLAVFRSEPSDLLD